MTNTTNKAGDWLQGDQQPQPTAIAGEMTPPTDNVSALRIRIPHYQEDEEYDYEYEQYCEEQYNPYGDLENYYACMEYFELLRRSRNQLNTDFWAEDFNTPVSPIPFMDEWS